jgi:hypothetical protein
VELGRRRHAGKDAGAIKYLIDPLARAVQGRTQLPVYYRT